MCVRESQSGVTYPSQETVTGIRGVCCIYPGRDPPRTHGCGIGRPDRSPGSTERRTGGFAHLSGAREGGPGGPTGFPWCVHIWCCCCCCREFGETYYAELPFGPENTAHSWPVVSSAMGRVAAPRPIFSLVMRSDCVHDLIDDAAVLIATMRLRVPDGIE